MQSYETKTYLDTPSIYKAWDARYQYDSSKRQLIPLYDNQQVGRAWGRDPNGRMNYALYYDGKGKPKENLLALHKQKLDQERGRRWDELNQRGSKGFPSVCWDKLKRKRLLKRPNRWMLVWIFFQRPLSLLDLI